MEDIKEELKNGFEGLKNELREIREADPLGDIALLDMSIPSADDKDIPFLDDGCGVSLIDLEEPEEEELEIYY